MGGKPLNLTLAYELVYAPVVSQYTLSPLLRSMGSLYLMFSYIMSALSQVGPARITSPHLPPSLSVSTGYLMASPRVSISPLKRPQSRYTQRESEVLFLREINTTSEVNMPALPTSERPGSKTMRGISSKSSWR